MVLYMKDRILKKTLKNKLNYIIILLIVLLGSTILIGSSYYLGILKFWNDFTTKSYDFNLLMVFTYDNVDKETFKNKLRNNERVKDVFDYTEYSSYAIFNDYVKENVNGEVNLVGTVPNTKKIIYGKDLDDETNGMICPSIFLPDSLIYHNNRYDIKNVINLSDKIGKNINMSYGGEYDISIPLIGIFDSEYDYSNPNFCYVNHATMGSLNKLYQPTLTNEGAPIFVLIENLEDAEDILDYSEISSYSITKRLNTEIGNKILFVTGIVSFVATFLSVIIIYLIYSRRIIKEYKNISIMMIVGYDKRKIKQQFYMEGTIIYLISVIIYIGLSYFVINNFVKWFLSHKVSLSLISLNINILTVIVSSLFILISIFLAIYMAMKKIDNLEIHDVIYE